MWSVDELIVAPATLPGDGLRSIVRLAGKDLAGLLARMVEAAAGERFSVPGSPPRAVAAVFGGGLAAEWGPLAVTVLHWPGPGGPIGGPLAELQLPCSQPLVDAVVAEACRHGARLARGGEFTVRAFLAGRLDLVQAEAVLAVVDARTPEELARALDRMAGGAGRRLGEIRAETIDLLADIEAAIDFADEATPDSVPPDAAAAGAVVAARLESLRADLAAVADSLAERDAAAVHGLPRVVLVGRPNIGKSSLFNRLTGREAALVADEAGTTRDWIEARLDAAGQPAAMGAACVLVDLAGISADGAARDPLTAAAEAAAREQVARAEVIVSCRDADELDEPAEPGAPAEPDAPAEPGAPAEPDAPAQPDATASAVRVIHVRTRCDRVQSRVPGSVIATSSRTDAGIAELRSAIAAAVATLPGRGAAGTLRMAVGVETARRHLDAAADLVALAMAGQAADEALVATRVRSAAESLGEVTGAEIGTDLLDRIFSRHCIGK